MRSFFLVPNTVSSFFFFFFSSPPSSTDADLARVESDMRSRWWSIFFLLTSSFLSFFSASQGMSIRATDLRKGEV